MTNDIQIFTPDLSTEIRLPYFDIGIPAGFPSPAQDYIEGNLDLNKELIQNKAATFCARVGGDSMEPLMHYGDLVIVDRSLDPFDQCIAVCLLDDGFTIKRLDMKEKGVVKLIPENPRYPIETVNSDTNFQIWGIVKAVIHKT